MHQWALPTIAVMLLAYGAVSGRLRSTPVSQAMVFVALGLLAGNRILDLVEVETANQFVRHLAEATLTLVLFCDAVRVNRGRLRHESALPTRLLVVGLPLTIVAGTLAGLALFPGWTCGRRPPWPPCSLPPTPPSGCRWSPTRGSPPASARA
jgi:sodium/hydrogen antiporter